MVSKTFSDKKWRLSRIPRYSNHKVWSDFEEQVLQYDDIDGLDLQNDSNKS